MRTLLRIAGLGVAVLGVMALALTVGPVVHGQTVRDRSAFNFTQFFGGTTIGVTVRDVGEADARRQKLPAAAGAVIDEVDRDSPAAKAGLKAGDVIVQFDGEKVRSARQVSRLIEESVDGRELEATVVRDGERVTVKLTPESASTPWHGAAPFLRPSTERLTMSLPDLTSRYEDFGRLRSFERLGALEVFGHGRLGAGVQDLTDQLAEYFGAPTGALVTTVDDDSAARAGGLKAGDVITKVNGEAVRNAEDLRRRLSGVSGEARITVMRDRKEQTLTVKIQDERVLRRER